MKWTAEVLAFFLLFTILFVASDPRAAGEMFRSLHDEFIGGYSQSGGDSND